MFSSDEDDGENKIKQRSSRKQIRQTIDAYKSAHNKVEFNNDRASHRT